MVRFPLVEEVEAVELEPFERSHQRKLDRNLSTRKCVLTAEITELLVVIGGGRPGGVARCGVVLGNGGNG